MLIPLDLLKHYYAITKYFDLKVSCPTLGQNNRISWFSGLFLLLLFYSFNKNNELSLFWFACKNYSCHGL